MKTTITFLFTALAATALFAAEADSKTEVTKAAKKLAVAANYSWTATSKAEGGSANWRQGPTEGKAEKGGFAHFTSSVGDNNFEVAFKGTKSAMKRDGDWESAEDLEGGDNAWMARRLRSFQAPATEAEDLAAKTKELKKGADGIYSGDLTEEGLKEMFARVRRGNQGSAPTDTKGWVKFWIKDGDLVKYEFNVQAKMTVGNDQREVEINRTTSVELKDVGKTKVQLPEEAKKKLS